MGTASQQQPNPDPSPDPSKKYWWIAGVAVPIIVALIGLISQHQKPSVMTPLAPGPSIRTAEGPVPQPTPLVLNPGGTIREGTLTFRKGAQVPVRIVFAADGTALSYRGVVIPVAPYELMDRCRWTGVAGVIRIDCTSQTSINLPSLPTMQLASSYNLKIDGSSLTGVRDGDVDGRSVVNMKRLQ